MTAPRAEAEELRDENLARNYRHFLFFRLLVVVYGYGIVAVSAWRDLLVFDGVGVWIHTVLAFYLAISVTLFLLRRRLSRSYRAITLQVAIDVLLQSALICTSGGVTSAFSPVLLVTLAAASGLLLARELYILASVAAILLTTNTLFHSFELPAAGNSNAGVSSQRFEPVYLLASVAGLYMISVLGSHYAQRLKGVVGFQREILENMGEGLIAVDAQNCVLGVNREARILLGIDLSETECIGRPLTELVRREKCPAVVDALEKDGKQRLETGVTIHGELHEIEVRVSQVRDERGEIRCRMALISDLKLQREMEVAEKRIQTLEDLQVMALGIAHEIRNPLASIRGCIQEISRSEITGDQMGRYMSIVCRESDRLDEILEQFLRYARPDCATFVPTDVASVLTEAVVLLRSREGIGNRRVVWEPPEQKMRVLGNRNQLVQLALNLGLNAIDATSPESGTVEISLRSVECSKVAPSGSTPVPAVEIEWKDNGVGLGDQPSENLFTPFFSTKESGSGLGLSIAARIVRAHRGTIEALSDRSSGAVFRVRLPLIVKTSPPSMVFQDSRTNQGVAASCLTEA